MLKKLYLEQRRANRNLQRMTSLLLMQTMVGIRKDAEEQNDKRAARLSQLGLLLIAFVQGMLLTMDILDLIEMKQGTGSDDY